jgi:hypothetical protein
MDTGATLSNFTCGDYPLDAGIPKTVFYLARIKSLHYSITSNNVMPKNPVEQERVLRGLASEPKTWKDVIKFEVPEWTAPEDYTYTIENSGVKSLRVILTPKHDAYDVKTINLRVDYKDTNWNEKVTAEMPDKIYRIKTSENLSAIGKVTGQMSEAVENLAPFLGIVFPVFANGLTSFLIFKNQFR